MSRARGEGTTYQRPDGRWVSEVTIGWRPDGAGGLRRIRRRVFGGTAEEAAAKRVQLVAQKQAGLPLPDGRLTAAAWMRHWLTEICPGRVRPSTLRTYESYYRLWIEPGIGAVRLRDLRAEHLDALYSRMSRAGRAGASQLQVHRIITRALQVALQREHVARNVAHLVDPPSGPKKDPSWLSTEQLAAVLAAAATDRYQLRWVVALTLGLRQGEALGLAWSDIDWDAGTLHVRRQLTRAPGTGVIMGPLKTTSSDRVLPLPATVLRLFRERRRLHLEERLAGRSWSGWESAGQQHELVFCRDNGRPIDHARDYRNWRALLVRAGVPAVPLHAARHTTATTLLAAGVPLAVAAGFMGHASTRMTERYTHVVPELARLAAVQLERAVWGLPVKQRKAPTAGSL